MAHILFIEDEPALQKTLGEFLRAEGHEVASALDGIQGLALARRDHPDLILLDLILPRMPGMEVFRELSSDPELAAIPVIVLTNVESSEAVVEAVELGAKAYLIKTNYSLDEVLAKVNAVLGQPQ